MGACFKVDRACGPQYCNCEVSIWADAAAGCQLGCQAALVQLSHVQRSAQSLLPDTATRVPHHPVSLPGDSQDPSCLISEPTLTDLLTEWRTDPICGAGNATNPAVLACSANYLARAAESPEAETAASLLKLECDGIVQRDTGACGPGRMPLISVTAQHQIHIFIFSVAMMHVVLGIVCVLLASWRIHSWRRMCSDDDEHVQRCVRGGMALIAVHLCSSGPLSVLARPGASCLPSRRCIALNQCPAPANAARLPVPQGADDPAGKPGSLTALALNSV